MELTPSAGNTLEQVVIHGDLKQLSPAQRVAYYTRVCESLGLNPLTRPFEYIVLNGRLTLYAKRDAADQLRRINGVSISRPDIRLEDGLVIVTVTATDKHGRSDSEIGAVAIEGLRGEARANAIMKAITKAKRRVTLSLCGLGWLDESEVDSVPGAQPVDIETGEALEPSALPEPSEGEEPRAEGPQEGGADTAFPPADEEAARTTLKRDLESALREAGITGPAASRWLAERFGGRTKVSSLRLSELAEAVRMATEEGDR